MTSYVYEGSELATFAHAVRWKAYVRRHVRPYLGPRVLEVGAGIGETTRMLAQGFHGQWTCLEPDAALAGGIHTLRARGELPSGCEVVVGSLSDLPADRLFDTLLYLDVLEHIERDADEVVLAARHLAPDGFLVVLAPAHQWLFTPFDEAIGHWRRYTRSSLARLTARSLRLRKLVYLDAVGLLASAANRVVLKSGHPTVRQITFWDRCMVPVSTVVDPLLGHRVGKSVLAVWQHQG